MSWYFLNSSFKLKKSKKFLNVNFRIFKLEIKIDSTFDHYILTPVWLTLDDQSKIFETFRGVSGDIFLLILAQNIIFRTWKWDRNWNSSILNTWSKAICEIRQKSDFHSVETKFKSLFRKLSLKLSDYCLSEKWPLLKIN